MMNPWLILGFVLALGAAATGGYFEGHSIGVTAQKVADQAQFDKHNADIAAQKEAAFNIYRQDADELLAAQETHEATKHTLEVQHVKDQSATDALRTQLDAAKLRYASSEVGGCRDGGGAPQGSQAAATSPQPTVIRELPAKVTGDLRQLALDADRLRNEYRLCYDYTQVAP